MQVVGRTDIFQITTNHLPTINSTTSVHMIILHMDVHQTLDTDQINKMLL